MLVFIDESGDPGMKLEAGASLFFVVTAVTFQNDDDALACTEKIDKLRKAAGLSARIELHFTKSSDRVRKSVLRGIAAQNFFYRSVVIDKKKLTAEVVPHDKKSFHQYVVGLTLELWRPYLAGASIDIDKGGGDSFSRSICRYVSKNFRDRDGKPLLKRVRTCRSSGSNLLQLADMVCGAVARSYKSNEPDAADYRRLIQARELEVVVRP